MKFLSLFTFSLFLCLSCNSDKSQNNSENKTVQVSPEQLKILQARDLEKSQPQQFIRTSGKYNKTLFGKMNITISFSSNAEYTTYKDVHFNITYKSKTNTVLGNSGGLVYYEYLAPSSSYQKEFKIDVPKATEKIEISVLSASVVKQI